MLSGLVDHLRLTAEARTGLSPRVVVFALVAAIAAAMAFVLVRRSPPSSGLPIATAR